MSRNVRPHGLSSARRRAATASIASSLSYLRTRPEETAQAVAAVPGHDVHVEVRHALADGVVDGHEGAVGAERAHHRARHTLDDAEERSDEIGVEIGQGHDVWPRHHKNVTLEHRPAIEEQRPRGRRRTRWRPVRSRR